MPVRTYEVMQARLRKADKHFSTSVILGKRPHFDKDPWGDRRQNFGIAETATMPFTLSGTKSGAYGTPR